MKKITVYREDSVSQVVYEDVKHCFWTADATVLTIAQVVNYETGEHRYINWMREKIAWYKEETTND